MVNNGLGFEFLLFFLRYLLRLLSHFAEVKLVFKIQTLFAFVHFVRVFLFEKELLRFKILLVRFWHNLVFEGLQTHLISILDSFFGFLVFLVKLSFDFGKTRVFKGVHVGLLRRCFSCNPVFVALGAFSYKGCLVLHLFILLHFLVSVCLQRLSVLAPDLLLRRSQFHFFLLPQIRQLQVSVQQQCFLLKVD